MQSTEHSKPSVEIGGVRYVEVSSKDTHGSICDACAFGKAGQLANCAAMIEEHAPRAFGGDCVQRDTHYVIAPKVEG